MKTKNKNVVRNLLEIHADFHKETFGTHITWEFKNLRTKEDPNWCVLIYENRDPATSFHYKTIGTMAEIAMVNHWMDTEERNGEKVIRFRLY